jgi:thiamine-phosphate pyrophosphorylase
MPYRPHHMRLFLSDRGRVPDWRTAILRGRASGLILRDYDAADRAAMANDMRRFCRAYGVSFAIAGDARLAQACGAGFHCPSYMLARPAARLGRANNTDTAAVHNEPELLAAARAGFKSVLISPAFPTASHKNAPALGVLRMQQLARKARALGLAPLALGGMGARNWRRLQGIGEPVFAGYAAIDAFGESHR